MIRLLVCDDSADFRASVRAQLAEQPEIAVAGEAADGQEAVDLALALSPDVVLMDVAMPVLDGVDATREIRRLLPDVRVVALTGCGERDVVGAMFEAGAAAYCVKGAPLWELERAVAGAAEPLVRLAHTLVRSANARGASELVAREVVELTGAGAAVYLAAPDVGLSLAAAAGPAAAAELTAAPGVVLSCFRDRRAVFAGRRELAELAGEGLPCAEALAVPLLADGEALGAVLAAMPAGAGFRIERELVAAVADLAAAAVANERRLAQTHDEARRDALTGLLNRRAFDERLDRLVADGGLVGVALLDLDGFKRINDTRGHAAGDDVLREVGRVLARRTRAHEEVYRLGGDELALLVPGGREAAGLVACRLLAALGAHRRGVPLPTASGGVAAFPVDGETPEELLARADLALYAAKAAGGDRVVVDLAEAEHGSRRAAEAPPASADAGSPAPRATGARVLPFPGREPGGGGPQPPSGAPRPARVLLVDDDERLRMLLRTTLEVIDIEIDEAASVPAARLRVAASRPDVVVLDLALPGPGGLTLCEELKTDPRTRDVGVVVLTGMAEPARAEARAAGADAFLSKPFSPLDLLAVVEELAGGLYEGPFGTSESRPPGEQLIRYAEDLRRLLEIEQGQRAVVQAAYRETVGALASALEAKDTGTKAHSQRVQQYALELAWAVEPMLLERPSVEYGFLLHDVGKIGIPDRILKKPGALTAAERRIVETHTVLGEQMLGGVALLQGEGLQVVRHHHERWDGAGYPDRLAGYDVPLPARIFAVADALDAMTSDRPYRAAVSWDAALGELDAEAARQFDPTVVEALVEREARLREIYHRFTGGPERPSRATGDPLSAEEGA
ncbi:MAG TPA: response regulator [Gaiellaceae bacterium]|nr:response regulator [Gaiellaceae bacterium]